jgi:hypothetical protein
MRHLRMTCANPPKDFHAVAKSLLLQLLHLENSLTGCNEAIMRSRPLVVGTTARRCHVIAGSFVIVNEVNLRGEIASTERRLKAEHRQTPTAVRHVASPSVSRLNAYRDLLDHFCGCRIVLLMVYRRGEMRFWQR